MNIRRTWIVSTAVMACVGACTVHASTVWDESLSGDLSNDGLAPTPVTIGLGANIFLGTVGDSGSGIDRDYFTFTVPTGMVWSSIFLLGNTTTQGVSFIGIQPGPQLTVTPTGAGVENLVAFGHYGNSQIGTDLLPGLMVNGAPPLPSGTYSVWVQETGGPANYGFNFVVSQAPVPLPGAAVLLISGIFGLTSLRRRKSA